MSTRILSYLLPALLVVVALVAFVAVDFTKTRKTAEADKPSFTEYVTAFARKERADEAGQAETVVAMGAVPGAEDADEIITGDVVSRDAVAPPSSWFSGRRDEVKVKVEFTCVKGVGGSKVCTAETMDR